ncbi:MAG TPA: response regulator [Ktedonobacterales bacterium]|jgi:two-component system response regulator ArlR|nr:response regulator [Ktedonobacterales bacterium]
MTRVLVVDDDADIRETMRALLEDAGYEVLEAADGKSALNTLRRGNESMVVLLDLQMPRVSGIEVLQEVAEQKRLASRHAFIVVTANTQTLPLAFVHLLTQLQVPLIVKPFDIDPLLEAVATAEERLEAAG